MYTVHTLYVVVEHSVYIHIFLTWLLLLPLLLLLLLLWGLLDVVYIPSISTSSVLSMRSTAWCRVRELRNWLRCECEGWDAPGGGGNRSRWGLLDWFLRTSLRRPGRSLVMEFPGSPLGAVVTLSLYGSVGNVGKVLEEVSPVLSAVVVSVVVLSLVVSVAPSSISILSSSTIHGDSSRAII